MSWHTGGAVELRRRRLLGALALGGVAWGAGVGSSRVRGAVQGGGKPQYQGDAANTGYSPDECPPTANLQQAWEIAPEELQGTQTTLAAADGNLYACGYHRSSLICVAPTTGTIRWRLQTGYADSDFNAVSYPAVGGGTVYCGVSEPWPDSRPSVHGLVYTLNASDGSERWRAGTGRGPAYPTLDGDSLYVGSQGALYVLATADGSGRWNHVPSDSDAFIGPPAVDGGTVYYTTDRGRLYALDTGGGSQRWASGVGAISAPSVVDGTVYVGRSGGVRALDAADGSGVWSASTAGPVGTRPPSPMERCSRSPSDRGTGRPATAC
ncbi:PQQ-binding-like beta-propeller repeat protein [Salinirubellus salinus]|uniref:PQQ-binding-like beta-propeller repeat protein n=1 Tax=Salinirubellus salinus TaxID=1364945 RepID=A0A9E7R0C2_9EURY|nr:PQQ-binding-like beta-propeller repeat protein [Salinirubellus salinus]UWM53346.1 PQQ-binding-like beta-propeller repeat protein [Salinirubellus salinus]